MNSVRKCLISVIIPVYNGQKYLVDALVGVQRQTLPPDEIIMVDDGSTDDSWNLMKSLADDKLKVLRQTHAGAAASRNLGIENSRGELIAFLDCDDLWEPEKLELQFNFLQQNPEVEVVSTQFREFYSSDISAAVKAQTKYKPGVLSGLSNSNIMVKRDVFIRIGLYDPRWQTGELMDWWSRAREGGILKAEIDRVLVSRRLHDNNLGRHAARNRKDYLGILKASIDRRRTGELARKIDEP